MYGSGCTTRNPGVPDGPSWQPLTHLSQLQGTFGLAGILFSQRIHSTSSHGGHVVVGGFGVVVGGAGVVVGGAGVVRHSPQHFP